MCAHFVILQTSTAIETITADMLQKVGTNSIILLMFVESQMMHI